MRISHYLRQCYINVTIHFLNFKTTQDMQKRHLMFDLQTIDSIE